VSELSKNLLNFLQSNIPAFPAVELLLFLSNQPKKRWKPTEIIEKIKPIVISPSLVQEYLALFKARGLLEGDPEAGFCFAPASEHLQIVVSELAQAYNERPVTLIRTIYALAENKIQSFADSFRLKSD